jgi:hypothetical protein
MVFLKIFNFDIFLKFGDVMSRLGDDKERLEGN